MIFSHFHQSRPTTKPGRFRLAASCVILSAVAAGAIAQSSAFALDPKGAVKARLGYFPVQIKLTDKKPSQITREPQYRTKPKYGIIHLGNGPKGDYVFALDEPTNADFKIYIDKNRDGDLTDDGDGAWNTKRTKGRVMYGVMDVTLRASYGTAKHETGESDYTIGLYRFPDLPSLICYRETARTGRIEVDGKAHHAVLVENDADGVYNKSDSKTAHPIWLVVDLNDDGKPSLVDVRKPFKLAGKAYEAKISADGFNFSMSPTTKVVAEEPKRAATPPLLKAGTPAPKFVAEKWGGGDLKLSDYQGKVVILDFWATWCGPCQKSMPHVEKVKQMLKGQDVAVVGVCVWDDRESYKKWVPENQSKYTFDFAFDPAGKTDPSKGDLSIAGKLFNVTGIPTTYIIDKNGNVADSIVGFDEGDTRLEESLKKLGIKL